MFVWKRNLKSILSKFYISNKINVTLEKWEMI